MSRFAASSRHRRSKAHDNSTPDRLSSCESHQSMSPRWGLNAKGMSVLKGKESASPRDIVSQEKLPKVVGGMKAITVREVKDKKYSRDIGTALSPQASAICPDKSEESVYKI